MIDPVAFRIGSFPVRWYGVMWAVGYLFMLYCPPKRVKDFPRLQKNWQDLVSWGLMASIVGGRIGEMFFYQFHHLKQDPWLMLRIWEGGMSFHGAIFLGFFVLLWQASRLRIDCWHLFDCVVIHLPLPIGLVRVANFINGELCGRVTESLIGMQVPGCGVLNRYPSTLIEAFSEGLLLWGVMLLCSRFISSKGYLSSIFLIGYAGIRLIIEGLFREPTYDLHPTIATATLLCLVMLCCGVLMMMYHIHQQCQQDKSK